MCFGRYRLFRCGSQIDQHRLHFAPVVVESGPDVAVCGEREAFDLFKGCELVEHVEQLGLLDDGAAQVRVGRYETLVWRQVVECEGVDLLQDGCSTDLFVALDDREQVVTEIDDLGETDPAGFLIRRIQWIEEEVPGFIGNAVDADASLEGTAVSLVVAELTLDDGDQAGPVARNRCSPAGLLMSTAMPTRL